MLWMDTLLLAFGSLSMLVVRLASPGLQGMGRFSASFAAGSLGGALLLLCGQPLANVLFADMALLGSFILLHVAVLQLLPDRRDSLWPGVALLCGQALVDILQLMGIIGGQPRIVAFGLLVAIQAVTTARTLWQLSREKVRAPATYSVALLLGFGAFNLLRSAAVAFVPTRSDWRDLLTLAAISLYLAVALGLAFGFFWMTTATLTAEVEHIASTDPLTRVFNRRVFMKWCDKELSRSQRMRVPFSVLMVDLDHFKNINDNFGHGRGDEVLVAAVERMQDSVRGIDVLCRWGGEEFAVLLPNAHEEATRIVAERIRENIQRMRVPLEAICPDRSTQAFLTVSIGAATYREGEDKVGNMLVRADEALYRAKRDGRNRVLVGA